MYLPLDIIMVSRIAVAKEQTVCSVCVHVCVCMCVGLGEEQGRTHKMVGLREFYI